MDHYNFSPGGAMLPPDILAQIHWELDNWHDQHFSILELDHYNSAFQEFTYNTEQTLRELLHVPDEFAILFLGVGARALFHLIPLNLCNDDDTVACVDTGRWSTIATQEIAKVCHVVVTRKLSENAPYYMLSSYDQVAERKAKFLHYTANETSIGLEFAKAPESDVLLIADMTSNILTKPIDWQRHAVVYAGAQKNAGVAGLSMVFIRRDLLGKVARQLPIAFNFQQHAAEKSLLVTPPIFAWYVAGLIFEWLKKQGGMQAIAKINQAKASKLYGVIDEKSLYTNTIAAGWRSRMNVMFNLPNITIYQAFLSQAKQAGFKNLHANLLADNTAIRASIYNGMPQQGVERLAAFMQAFADANPL